MQDDIRPKGASSAPDREPLIPDSVRTNVQARGTWTRLLYMLVFGIAFGLAELVLCAIVIFQFIATLITGAVNTNLQRLGLDISRYCYALLRYLTYNTDEKPYPFGEWESTDPDDG